MQLTDADIESMIEAELKALEEGNGGRMPRGFYNIIKRRLLEQKFDYAGVLEGYLEKDKIALLKLIILIEIREILKAMDEENQKKATESGKSDKVVH